MTHKYGLALAMMMTLAGAADAATENTLTADEIAEGWILLFDGQTKFGWEAEEPKLEEDWVVKEGTITCNPQAPFNHLKHKTAFSDFHLTLDFRVNTKGNSGVFFRGANDGKFVNVADGKVRIDGYEAQIDDNDPRGLLNQTGALYDVLPATKLITGENEWRRYEIIAEGDHLVTKINGETVLDGRDARFKRGHIGLQHHHVGNVIEFRNIKLKPLGLKSMFNGKDLSGWRVLDPPENPKEKMLKERWLVRDGMLHVDVPPVEGVTKGGRGYLETEAQYKDFVMQLDIRTNGPHFNSGVFFRCQPGQIGIGYESQVRNEWEGDDRTKPVDYGTGAIYRRVAARKVVSNDNEFFTKTLAVSGPHMAVWINGYQVTDFTDTRPKNDNAREGYCPNRGTISLQSHDPTTDLDFKNFRIAELPE